jgi:hypothetical protein
VALMACAGSVFAQPAHDSCASPESFSGYASQLYDNTLATLDGPAVSACGIATQVQKDVWYCWTATQSGPVTARTCGGAAYDTVIAVYDDCACDGSATQIGCGDDNCATQSSITFLASSGRTYMIRAGSYAAATGGSATLVVESGFTAGPIVNPANGHSYFLAPVASWTAGEALAVAVGGHLVTINDAAENTFVQTQVLGFDGLDRRGWIGFNDVQSEGTFVWASGEAATYTNWNPGEPNNSSGIEHYAEMLGGSGEWNDVTEVHAATQFALIEVDGAPTCPADLDDGSGTGTPDGGVTIDDLIYFLSLFELGDIGADLDDGSGTGTHDGGVTIDDLVFFLTRFDLGC